LLVNLVPSLRVSMTLYRACSLPRTAFSSFCVMRRQRVRLLLALCHSSLSVLSRTRPRSLAAALAAATTSSSTASLASRSACVLVLLFGFVIWLVGASMLATATTTACPEYASQQNKQPCTRPATAPPPPAPSALPPLSPSPSLSLIAAPRAGRRTPPR
jgi:hypothetical protein